MKRLRNNELRREYKHEEHNSSYKSLIQEDLSQHKIIRFPKASASPDSKDPLTNKDLQIMRARLWVRGLLTASENERIAQRIERAK